MIHHKIKAVREENNLSQKEFGEIIGFNQRTISHWEQDRSKPDYRTLKKISTIFKKPIAWFFNEEYEIKQVDMLSYDRKLQEEIYMLLEKILEIEVNKTSKGVINWHNFVPWHSKIFHINKSKKSESYKKTISEQGSCCTHKTTVGNAALKDNNSIGNSSDLSCRILNTLQNIDHKLSKLNKLDKLDKLEEIYAKLDDVEK